MSQTALVRFGAKTEHTTSAPLLSEAELRAGFEAFGDRAENDSAGELWSPEPRLSFTNPFNLPIPLSLSAGDARGPSTALARYAPQRLAPELKSARLKLDQRLIAFLLKGMDWLIVLAAAELAARWSASASLPTLAFGDAASILICALALKAGLWLTDCYAAKPHEHCPEHASGGLALGAILGVAVAALIAPNARAAGALAAILPLAGLLLAGLHAAFALWIKAAHRQGAFSETVVVIGATDAAQRFLDRALKIGDARIVAVFDDRLARSPLKLGQAPVCGGIEDLLDWESLPLVDRIVIALPQKAEHRVRDIVNALRGVPQRIDLLLDVRAESVRGRGYDHVAEAPMARLSSAASPGGRALLKRIEDLVLGSALLALFAPLMALVALGVKLVSKGPALVRERCHGFNNRVIRIYKFRGVGALGRALRHTGLIDLPRLLNVLRGEMSLVGPRPHAIGMRAAERDLNQIVAEYAHRHRVKPGLTGWAQIKGPRGIDTPKALRERVRLDLDYVSRASLWFDLWILARAVPAIVLPRKAKS